MRLAPLTALLLGLASLPGLAQTSLEARVIVRWKSEAPVVRAKATAISRMIMAYLSCGMGDFGGIISSL